MGVVRARLHKASVLPTEYGLANFYNAPLDLDGKPFRFQWQTEILRKIKNASLRASSNSRPNYMFKFIHIPNRYWKEPVGNTARVLSPVASNTWITSYNIWISHVFIRAAQVRLPNPSCRMAPVQYEPACLESTRKDDYVPCFARYRKLRFGTRVASGVGGPMSKP